MADQLPTLAEALGYSATDRVLMLTADEYGECQAMNSAIFEMFAAGTLTSASLGMVYPWATQAALFHREHPEYDVGIHLILTCQHRTGARWGPLTPAGETPGLRDPHGYLWPSNDLVWEHATAEEAYRECRAQIERFLSFGLEPSHLDPHMGTVRKRLDWRESVYARLGREYGLPLRMLAPADEAERELRERLLAAGQLMSDHMRQMRPGGAKDPESFRRFTVEQLRGLRPGVTDYYVHPGHDTPELRALVKNWPNRLAEHEIFHRHPAVRETIAAAGIKLISWRPVLELQRRGVKVRSPW